MEVVGGIASVAGAVGILGLVGQSIDGILKIKKHFDGLHAAPRTASNFLGDLDSLKGTLVAIKELIEKVPEEWLVGDEASNVNVLASQSEKCRDDIKLWEKDAVKLNTKSSKALDAFFKKLRVVADAGKFSEFHRKVASHQQGIQISLDILGRAFDIRSLKQGQASDEKFDSFAKSQTSFGNQMICASESFSTQLETVSTTLNRVEQNSNASMSSIASQLSHLIDLVSANSGGSVQAGSKAVQVSRRDPSKGPGWCCGALAGIESAFSEEDELVEDTREYRRKSEIECLYCGEVFDTVNTNWYVRGKHLAATHHFGTCNLHFLYQTQEKFRQHLTEYHQMSMFGQSLVDRHFRSTKAVLFHRGPESDGQIDRQIDEVAETEGLYHARLKSILQSYEDACSYASVSSQVPKIDIAEPYWLMEREVACLREEFIIGGHTFQALDNSVTLGKVSPMGDPNDSMLREASISQHNELPALQMKDKVSQSVWINFWLYEMLQKSPTARLILRDPGMAKTSNGAGLQIWLQEVEQLHSPSDGAVDSRESRDSLRWSKQVNSVFECSMTRCRRKHKSWTELDKFLEHLKRSHALTGSAALKVAQTAETLDYKARSRQSRQLLTRLQGNGEFKVVAFSDKAMLDDDIENWPTWYGE